MPEKEGALNWARRAPVWEGCPSWRAGPEPASGHGHRGGSGRGVDPHRATTHPEELLSEVSQSERG